MKSLAENKAAVAIAATEAIDAQMNLGALKYDPNDWRKESIVRHVRRAIRHAITHLEITDGDREADGEEHLEAAVCRITMALVVSVSPRQPCHDDVT